MLPRPTTIATCTPLRTTSATCRAIEATVDGSMPRAAPPANASPESFSSTRFHCGGVMSIGHLRGFGFWLLGSARDRERSERSRRGSGAYFKTGEALERHAGLVEHRLHGLLVVADVGLVEQHPLLEEPGDAAFDDLRQRLLGLALLARGGLGDLALLRDNVRGDLVAGEVLRA